ncbi:type I-U CRISPR-associated protein Csb2 [Nocardiopsis composta]
MVGEPGAAAGVGLRGVPPDALHRLCGHQQDQPQGGSQHWPGRTTTERTRAGSLPACEVFAVVWPQARAGADTVQVLADLAWKVPYLGRSSSPVALRAHTALKMDSQWQVWRPARLDAVGAGQLRAPTPATWMRWMTPSNAASAPMRWPAATATSPTPLPQKPRLQGRARSAGDFGRCWCWPRGRAPTGPRGPSCCG